MHGRSAGARVTYDGRRSGSGLPIAARPGMPPVKRSRAGRAPRRAAAKPRAAPPATRGPNGGLPASIAIRERPPSTFESAEAYFPASRALPALRDASAACRACDLHLTGTRTVFGEGAPRATVVLVGEQPGDQEDRQGKPFVGPAGRVLDEALEAAGISRDEVYVTNVVKHFKWDRGGKTARRIHRKPSDAEVRACAPWLHAELAAIRPRVVVPLGATAAKALLGSSFRVTRDRGKAIASPAGYTIVATVHPSSVLRAPTPEARRAGREDFFRDLKAVAGAR